jgi:hypothetical protein
MVCEYYPEVPNQVEGTARSTVIRGRFCTSYGTSLYEFHYEYPILQSGAAWGCRKDTVSVIEADGSRTPLLDRFARSGQRVLCTRSGMDVATEIELLGCRARDAKARAGIPGADKRS